MYSNFSFQFPDINLCSLSKSYMCRTGYNVIFKISHTCLLFNYSFTGPNHLFENIITGRKDNDVNID